MIDDVSSDTEYVGTTLGLSVYNEYYYIENLVVGVSSKIVINSEDHLYK